MNQVSMILFSVAFKLSEMLAPTLAGRWAVRLFFTPRRHERPQREKQFIADATIRKMPLRSEHKLAEHEDYYIRYDWGIGPAVLLVHGWEGRGSQMGSFIQPLLNAGYRVITFDAFAHGDSPGKRTNMLEFAQIVTDIADDVGGFAAIIGHSVGGAAAGYAVSMGVRADKLITICSPTTIDFIFESFTRLINASPKTVRYLYKFWEDFSGKKADELSFTKFASRIDTQGLIIHDKDDKEIPYSQALELKPNWKNSQLMLTEGLGHRRILNDAEIISNVANFLGNRQMKNIPETTARHRH